MKKEIFTSLFFAFCAFSLPSSAQTNPVDRLMNYTNLIGWDDSAPNFGETSLTDAGVLYHLGDSEAQGEDRFGEEDAEGFGHSDKLNALTKDHVYDLKPGDKIILFVKSTANGAQVRCKLNYLEIEEETGDLYDDKTDALTSDGNTTVDLKGNEDGEYVVFDVPAEKFRDGYIGNKVIVTGHDADLLGIYVAPSYQTTKEDRRDNYLHKAVQGNGWNWVYDISIPQAKEGDHPLVKCGPFGTQDNGGQDGNAYFKRNNTDNDLPVAGGLSSGWTPTEYYSGWILPETVNDFRNGFGFAYTGQISRVGIVKGNDAHNVLDMYFESAFFHPYEFLEEDAEPLTDAKVGDRVAFDGTWDSDGTCNISITDGDGNEIANGQFPFSVEVTADNVDFFTSGNYHIKAAAGALSGVFLWPNIGNDTSNGIKGITGDKAESKTNDNVYYNLSGQRVSAPVKGIYIHNGKKIIVK